MRRSEAGGYSTGHPWYYLLGGPVLSPKEIRAEAIESGYRGYMADDIAKADARAEPQRSEQLRRIRAKVVSDLNSNLRRYREVARALNQLRKDEKSALEKPVCADVHVAISLKHNHIYNDFAHLAFIDFLLSRQMDLFDL